MSRAYCNRCSFTGPQASFNPAQTGEYAKCNAYSPGHQILMTRCRNCVDNESVFHCCECWHAISATARRELEKSGSEWTAKVPSVVYDLCTIPWHPLLLACTGSSNIPKIETLEEILNGSENVRATQFRGMPMLEWKTVCPCCYDATFPPLPDSYGNWRNKHKETETDDQSDDFSNLKPQISCDIVELTNIELLEPKTGNYHIVKTVRLIVHTAKRLISQGNASYISV